MSTEVQRPLPTGNQPGRGSACSDELTSGFTLIELLVVVAIIATWDASQDRARWRGCYSFAFRAKDPVSGAIGNPVNFYGTNAWDAVALREGNFAFAFDHLRVASAGTPFLPGRYSCHPAGYNCVYYDGHVQFFGGSQADTIDFRVTTSTTSYNGNFNSCRWVFDRSQGIIY